MREIKFRAWDKELNRMLSPKGVGLGFAVASLTTVDYLIPMQYTGLKDKNGVEIYEGDILHLSAKPQETNQVEYYDGIWHLTPHGLNLSD